MRTFTCAMFDAADTRPTVTLILAADEERARVLARSELARAHRAVAVEIREGGRLIDVVRAA